MKKKNKRILNYALTVAYDLFLLFLLISLIIITKRVLVGSNIAKNLESSKEIINKIDNTTTCKPQKPEIIVLNPTINNVINIKDYNFLYAKDMNETFLTLKISGRIFKVRNYLVCKNFKNGDLILYNYSGNYLKGKLEIIDNKYFFELLPNPNNVTEKINNNENKFLIGKTDIIGRIILEFNKTS